VKDIITPAIVEAHKSDPKASQYVVVESQSGSIKIYWPSEETMGEFTYQPLLVRLVVEKRGDDWPQLAFVWGYPVLGLRDLVWDYIKECGQIEEFSARQRLRKTVDGLTDILTKFENPVAQPVATAVPAMAAVAAVGGPQPQQPALPVTHRGVTGLTTIAQKNQNWCWAAVSVMMRKLYANDGVTQEQVVRNLYGNENDQQGPLVLKGLKHRNAGQGVTLSWPALKGEIDANKPFIFAGGQHYMVATGYEEQGATRTLLYWDPLPRNAGRSGRMSYESYCNTVRLGGATYHGFSGPNRQ